MFYKNRSNYSFSIPSRLIFQFANTPQNSSSQENSEHVLTASDEIHNLKGTIAQLRGENCTSDEIKTKLKADFSNDTTRIIQHIMNGSRPRSIDPQVYAQIHSSSIDTEVNRDLIIDYLVDNYMNQRREIIHTTRNTVRNLSVSNTRTAPEASSNFNVLAKTKIPTDFNGINPQIAQLKRYKAAHSKNLGKSENDQLTIPKIPIDRKAITAKIDFKTDPDRSNATIPDYEDSWNPLSKETNSNNRTRRVLDGYLYGIYIFNGGDKAGQNMINMKMKKAEKLYSEKWGNRLDYTDLQYGMHLQPYLERVKSFSKFDRVRGLMASLLLMNDTYNHKPAQKNKYHQYLISQFQKLQALDTKDNEDIQLNFLFKIKPSIGALNTIKRYQTAAEIKNLTDPSRNNALIGDYAGSKSIKHSIEKGIIEGTVGLAGAVVGGGVGAIAGPPGELGGTIAGATGGVMEGEKAADSLLGPNTRRQLEGVMFAGSIWGGMAESKKIYRQAGKLYNSRFYKVFDQTSLNSKTDGMGLGTFLQEATTWTKFDYVKGCIAQLLKYASEIKNKRFRTTYTTSLKKKFNQIKGLTEKEQINMLVGISFNKDSIAEASLNVINLLQNAATQHPQLRFSKIPIAAPAAFKEIQDFIKRKTRDIQWNLHEKFNYLKTKKIVSDNQLAKYQDRIQGINNSLNQALQISYKSTLQAGVNGNYLGTLYQAQKDYYVLQQDMDRDLYSKKEKKTTHKKHHFAAHEILPVGLDIYARNWRKGHNAQTDLGDYQGKLRVTSQSKNKNVMMRGNNGRVIEHLKNNVFVNRTSENVAAKPWQVRNRVFVQITYNGEIGWIADNYMSRPEKKPSVAPKKAETLKKSPPKSVYDQVFDKITPQIESNKSADFIFTFDEMALPCRIQKAYNGYDLMWRSPDAGGGHLIFPNMSNLRKFIEEGKFKQNLTLNQLQFPQVWKRYAAENLVGQANTVTRTGPYSVVVELDWKRNNVFETGNPLINLEVKKGGIIRYHIEKDYIGVRGENFRDGEVGNLNQLIDVLSHIKNWSENYLDREGNPNFPSQLHNEQLVANLTNKQTFNSHINEIGTQYDFNSSINRGVAVMQLNWSNSPQLINRHRSLLNPTLEVILNNDNSITYKIYNKSGLNGKRMGTYATVNNMGQLFDAIATIKSQPSHYLTTPYNQMPTIPLVKPYISSPIYLSSH